MAALGSRMLLVAAVCSAVAVSAGRFMTARAGARESPRFASECSDPFPATEVPANRLMLTPAPPASNPLQGASFFVDGPAHGPAAGAIAQLLGIDATTPPGHALPSFKDSESWATFAGDVAARLAQEPAATAHQIVELEKIASEPETERISRYSAGGTPQGIFDQMQKLFCDTFMADPGAIPVFTTDFMHATLGGCPTLAALDAYRPGFQAQIDALAQATGNRPVVFLLELDAVGSSACIEHTGVMPAWESLLKYEAMTLEALPHTAVYLEGGYSDANTPAYAARILNAGGIGHVQGFFTNDTHENWTINEIKYGDAVSKLTGGANFIIDTADNGNGPLLNPDPRSQGVEDLCNAPGRALGPQPTTSTGVPNVSAFLWTHVPGNSSGCGGGPPGGDFWPARAAGLAERANNRLGPNDPSRPY